MKSFVFPCLVTIGGNTCFLSRLLLRPIQIRGSLYVHVNCLTLLTPIRNQDRISPYNINTISSRQGTRIKRNINQEIVS